MSAVSIDQLTLAEDPARWEALGFAVSDEECQIGTVALRLEGTAQGRGITGWSLRGVAATGGSLRDVAAADLDGLPTSASDSSPREAAGEHPNGALALDHVVAMSPALDRTVAALQTAGLDLRRVREEPTPAGAPRQAFFRLGEVILEVVQEPAEAIERHGRPDRPARLWGLALVFSDLERAVGTLGEHASPSRPAVQPGRRIATLRRSAGLSVPLALMSRPERIGATT